MPNNRLKQVIIPALIILPVFILLGSSACKITENSVTRLINQPAPNFNLKNLEGENVRLSDLSGKTVLMNFWMTTSPPCVNEMFVFQQLYDEWKARSDVVFLSIDLGEDLLKVKEFLDRRNLTFPVWLDMDWETGRVYQVHTAPATCLVDNQGYLKYFKAGPFTDKTALDGQLAAYISPQP